MIIVETKMTQPVELDEEPVDPQFKRSKGTKTFSFFQNACSTNQGMVEIWSRDGWSPMVTYQALNANG